MGLRIFATPDPTIADLNGDGLSDDYNRAGAAADSVGYKRANGYTSIADLIARIQAILTANPTECLQLIEVYAHGNPTVCDGIKTSDVATIGAALRTWHAARRLCDSVSIYLTGCNTGVWFRGSESLAESLSRQTPTEASDHVRVNVYGSVGYLGGTHVEGNTNTSIETTVKHGGQKDYFAPFPAVTDSQGNVHPGSTAAQGAASYRGFREGRPI